MNGRGSADGGRGATQAGPSLAKVQTVSEVHLPESSKVWEAFERGEQGVEHLAWPEACRRHDHRAKWRLFQSWLRGWRIILTPTAPDGSVYRNWDAFADIPGRTEVIWAYRDWIANNCPLRGRLLNYVKSLLPDVTLSPGSLSHKRQRPPGMLIPDVSQEHLTNDVLHPNDAWQLFHVGFFVLDVDSLVYPGPNFPRLIAHPEEVFSEVRAMQAGWVP